MKEKPQKRERKKKVKVDFSVMGSVIVAGRFAAKQGDTVYLRRDHRNDLEVCMCTVMKVHTDGIVSLYDETRGQWFSFNSGENVNVRSPDFRAENEPACLDECKNPSQDQSLQPS